MNCFIFWQRKLVGPNSPLYMHSIYIHIPFCVSKCHYCDFFSIGMGKKNIPEQAYLTALRQEIAGWETLLTHPSDQAVKTIFFGGGTPSLLSGEAINGILHALQDAFCFSGDVEVTLEVNPKTADPKKLCHYRRKGVNRISMGVQTLDGKILEKLGRAHTAAEALQSLDWILEAGFSGVSVDLMYGLPYQDLRGLKSTLGRLKGYPLRHLSAYELILEEKTPFWEQYLKGKLSLPSTEDILAMREAIAQFALNKSMVPYEISNYAVPGQESRHNRHYWNYGSFLGFGAGAVSFLAKEDLTPEALRSLGGENYQEFYGWRLTNPRDLRIYMDSPAAWETRSVERISYATAMGEFMMMGLRKSEGVLYQTFEKKFSRRFPSEFQRAIHRMDSKGWLEADEKGCRLTPEGILLSNEVLQEFL